jgi:hypothetical protein
VTRRVESYVIAGLLNVRYVVQFKEAKPLDRFVERSVNEVTDYLVHGGVVDSIANSSTWRRKRTE